MHKKTLWHPAISDTGQPLSSLAKQWLSYRDSMTTRMQEYFSEVRVEVLRQDEAEISEAEAPYLGIAAGSRIMTREVIMWCDDEQALYARTLMPETLLTGPGAVLTSLGTRALGSVLFSEPDITRSAFDYACMTHDTPLYQHVAQCLQSADSHLWSRRSIFTWQAHPLSLMEVFRPNLLAKAT